MTLDYYKVQLKETAEKLSEFKKGILAVDESTKTIGKRLFDIDVENTEENRQAYRGMLFTTPDLGKYISGAILYERHSIRIMLMEIVWLINLQNKESFQASKLIQD